MPRILQLRQRWQRGIGLVALCLCLPWGGLMTRVWHDALRDVGKLSQLLRGASERYQSPGDDTRRAAQARQNVQAWWQLVTQAPRWRFISLVFPSSWLSSPDAHTDSAYRRVSERLLVRPLCSLLKGEASDLRAICSDDQPGLKEGDDPSQWKDYPAVKGLVARATILKRHNRLFAQAIDSRKMPLDDPLQLSNDALGSSHNAGNLTRLVYYNRTLFAERPADLAAFDLGRVGATMADSFHDLMARWLNAYLLTDSLERTSNALTQKPTQLGRERDTTVAQLLGVGELINHLQQQVNRINPIWDNGVGQDLVPGYQSLLKSAQQRSLLGNRVEELQNLMMQLQQQFRSEWIAPPEAAGNGLLVKQGAMLKLADDLLGLKCAIDDLKTKDLASVALAGKILAEYSPLSIDDIGVTQASSFFNDFSGYYESTLLSLNLRYRYSVLHAVASAMTEAMWQSPGPRSHSLTSRNASRFDVQVKQVQALQATLLELQDMQAGARLSASLSAPTVANTGQALRDIDERVVLCKPVDLSCWLGAPNFGLQAFRAQDSAELRQSLTSQFNTMVAVAECHTPALGWLQAQQSSLATADYNAFVRFSASNAELQKFKASNPASTAAQPARLVGNDFNRMDVGSCADILSGVLLSSSRSDLATHLVNLCQGVLGRCQSLQQQQAAQAWKDLVDYPNQYFAGRFPFAYSLEATDAEPERAWYLLRLMETHLSQVREGLAQVRSPDLPAAEDFVRCLEQAQSWLGPLFERDKLGLLGVILDVDWRSDRSLERGADRVIAWSLHSGDQEGRFPGAQDKGLTRSVGDLLKIMLHWVKDGSQRSADDPRQANLAVADLETGWSYQGSWALPRVMRAHFSRQRPPNVDYTEFSLVLQLPVYAPYSPENEAWMFLRLSLMSLGGKTPLSIQPPPVRAPQSPFATLLPAIVASIGGTL